jgi:hypothetical protein
MTSLELEAAPAAGATNLIPGKVVEAKPKKPAHSSRAKSRGADEPSEDEFPDLVAAK